MKRIILIVGLIAVLVVVIAGTVVVNAFWGDQFPVVVDVVDPIGIPELNFVEGVHENALGIDEQVSDQSLGIDKQVDIQSLDTNEQVDIIVTDEGEVVINMPMNSDPLSVLSESEKFIEHGFVIEEIRETVKLGRVDAIIIADGIVENHISSTARSTTAILARFTNTEMSLMPDTKMTLMSETEVTSMSFTMTPLMPESDVELIDYPVWIVTYHGVMLQTRGRHDIKVYADKNVVIDAMSGEVLEVFSYIAKG